MLVDTDILIDFLVLPIHLLHFNLPDKCSNPRYHASMTTKFTYWQTDDGLYLGYLNEYPDHWTQGETLEDLKEHLRDLHATFAEGAIPGIKREAELELA